jgi:hypothetical protein
VTPLYLLILLTWWGATEAIPILLNERSAGSSAPVSAADTPYVNLARGVLLLFVVTFVVFIRAAWKRNGYDDRKGFTEIATDRAPAEAA